jgi:hypothetical protein
VFSFCFELILDLQLPLSVNISHSHNTMIKTRHLHWYLLPTKLQTWLKVGQVFHWYHISVSGSHDEFRVFLWSYFWDRVSQPWPLNLLAWTSPVLELQAFTTMSGLSLLLHRLSQTVVISQSFMTFPFRRILNYCIDRTFLSLGLGLSKVFSWLDEVMYLVHKFCKNFKC